MKEEDKNIKLLLEGFEQFLITTIIEVQFNSFIKEWAKEVRVNFHD